MRNRIITQPNETCIAFVDTNSYMDGNGVFIGNILLTSAHVIANSDKFGDGVKEYKTKSAKCYENNDYWYKKALRVLSFNRYGWNFDDFALYDGNRLESPFSLSYDLPIANDILETYSIKREVEEQPTEYSHIIFSSIRKERLVEHVDNAKVLYIRGNYIFCEMNGMLEKGRSGCPLIKDNKVYGILRGGDDKKICWFQSSVSILKRIQEHNIHL